MPHVHKLPSGTWRVIIKHNGQTRTGTAATKSEVQRVGARLLLSLGASTTTSRSTVGELVAADIATSDWSATYRADVISIFDRIPATFADLPARSVIPRDATNLYRQLKADEWKPHRIRRLHEVLSAAYAHAVEEGVLADNPFRNVRKPPAPRRELIVPTDDEVAAILAAPKELVERLALRLAATLGGRRGEVVALQWRDVDLERETLVIRRSLAYTPASGVVTGITKTGDTGHRVLSLDPLTVDMLAQHYDHQAALCVPQPDAKPIWVIADNAGQHHDEWRPDRLTHVFAAARKKARVTGVRLHDLRHYVATTMLHDGETPIDVANQLGHSDTSTTLKVYAHYLPGRGRDSAVRRAIRLDKRSAGAEPRTPPVD